ncbi:hypothetical protein ATANTOWER_030900 [Ataeniobius toweri]|uniref:Uncharacterized protein n=1 Tax=Ataeniobius toweri TaxID=208326 RepID=A0ABU7CJZ3_9TELE|nr:hypothetical protein [Ataeniobius toweri]
MNRVEEKLSTKFEESSVNKGLASANLGSCGGGSPFCRPAKLHSYCNHGDAARSVLPSDWKYCSTRHHRDRVSTGDSLDTVCFLQISERKSSNACALIIPAHE